MLQVSIPIAQELLAQCVRQGQALVQRASLVGDRSDYESWKAARNQWIEPTTQALEHMYGGREQADEFSDAVTPSDGGKRWQQQYAVDVNAVEAALDVLTLLQGELAFERGSEPAEGAPELSAAPSAAATAEIPAHAGEQEQGEQVAGGPLDEGSDPDAQQPSHERQEPELQRLPEPEPQQLPEPEREREPQQLPDPERESQQSPERASEPDPAPAPVGAELAPAPVVSSRLAQQAAGALSADRAGAPGPAPSTTKQVLLAHGRNERWMLAVARLLEQAGTHDVTILNDRTNEPGALAEQFGERVQGSRYAIVLLTADDIGAPRVDSEDEPYFSPRAHQAVVFEMGFLVAALAPGCVCVLYEEGVQLPCDLDGISYVRLDVAGTWQPKLLLALRKAGFDYDLNKLVAA